MRSQAASHRLRATTPAPALLALTTTVSLQLLYFRNSSCKSLHSSHAVPPPGDDAPRQERLPAFPGPAGAPGLPLTRTALPASPERAGGPAHPAEKEPPRETGQPRPPWRPASPAALPPPRPPRPPEAERPRAHLGHADHTLGGGQVALVVLPDLRDDKARLLAAHAAPRAQLELPRHDGCLNAARAQLRQRSPTPAAPPLRPVTGSQSALRWAGPRSAAVPIGHLPRGGRGGDAPPCGAARWRRAGGGASGRPRRAAWRCPRAGSGRAAGRGQPSRPTGRLAPSLIFPGGLGTASLFWRERVRHLWGGGGARQRPGRRVPAPGSDGGFQRRAGDRQPPPAPAPPAPRCRAGSGRP